MSKKSDEDCKDCKDCKDYKEIKTEEVVDNLDSVQEEVDIPDDSGRKLYSLLAHYDVIYSCWRDMKDYISVKQVPLCEYMTIYNFIDFVENNV
jgi:hypothetical protein